MRLCAWGWAKSCRSMQQLFRLYCPFVLEIRNTTLNRTNLLSQCCRCENYRNYCDLKCDWEMEIRGCKKSQTRVREAGDDGLPQIDAKCYEPRNCFLHMHSVLLSVQQVRDKEWNEQRRIGFLRKSNHNFPYGVLSISREGNFVNSTWDIFKKKTTTIKSKLWVCFENSQQ